MNQLKKNRVGNFVFNFRFTAWFKDKLYQTLTDRWTVTPLTKTTQLLRIQGETY